jgi:hypothetical protein
MRGQGPEHSARDSSSGIIWSCSLQELKAVRNKLRRLERGLHRRRRLRRNHDRRAVRHGAVQRVAGAAAVAPGHAAGRRAQRQLPVYVCGHRRYPAVFVCAEQWRAAARPWARLDDGRVDRHSHANRDVFVPDNRNRRGERHCHPELLGHGKRHRPAHSDGFRRGAMGNDVAHLGAWSRHAAPTIAMERSIGCRGDDVPGPGPERQTFSGSRVARFINSAGIGCLRWSDGRPAAPETSAEGLPARSASREMSG